MLALGLISGTSADGVSAAIIHVKAGQVILLGYATYPYPSPLRKKALGASGIKTPELSKLNFELGEFFAGSALKILKQFRISPKHIAAIGSHGQTVYHGPKDNPAN